MSAIPAAAGRSGPGEGAGGEQFPGHSLDILLTGVGEGSEKLYDGVSASSLDGQALAVAIEAHLGRPAIPPASELLRGLCAAAGLCLKRAKCMLRAKVADLHKQAAVIQEAVERSQSFWRMMLDGLPAGCRRPFSPTCRWRRRARCKHQGRRLCLGEPPWQPKTANAVVAAPRRAEASRCAASTSAASRLCRGLEAAASSAAAVARSVFCSSSTSSRERAPQEAARRDVPAARARAYRLSDEDPRGGTGASSSLSRVDFGNSAG